MLSLIQGTTFLGVQWDSTTVQATSSPARVETITIVTQKQRLSSLVAPSVSHKGCMQVPSYPSSVEKTRIFGSGCPIEGMLPSKKYFDGHLSHRLGCGLRRSPTYGLWNICHLTWPINCLEMLAVLLPILPDLRGYHVFVWSDNILVVSYIQYKLPRQVAFESTVQVDAAYLALGSGQTTLTERKVHILGHLNVKADVLLRQGLRPGEWRL